MVIKNVKNIDELDDVLNFIHSIFPPDLSGANGAYKYSRDFWIDRMNELPELLLYAKCGAIICASVFAWNDNGNITVACCGVDSKYRGKGIGRALMSETEKRVKSLGFHGIALGSVENAERFYEKLGYTGTLLIQSEKDSIEDLKSLNTKYEVIATGVYDAAINQVYLRLPAADRDLQRKYKEIFPESYTQMVYGKQF